MSDSLPTSTDVGNLAHGRLTTGIERLDAALGGGLIPGTLTVVEGATGIGKTQLGVQFAHSGLGQEGETGIFLDLTSRGDSQNHAGYAQRLCGWILKIRSADEGIDPLSVWSHDRTRCDYLHLFDRSGRRVTIADLEQDDWRLWKIELARKLDRAVAFFYGNFVHGVRRCVIDGIEPVERASDSFQFHVFDYVYHQILRKESEWVARDLFRAHFRANEEQARLHRYDHGSLGCLLLCTSREVMLDQLLERPIDSGDVLSNANTVILMGKVREGGRVGRALHVAKHRGSFCEGGILPYDVTDRGLVFC
jgi:KaiC